MLFYKVPNPDEELLLRGWRVDGVRVVKGGALVLPFVRRATFLPLAPQDVDVTQTCYEQQGVEFVVHATVSFRIDHVEVAGGQFASHPERMAARIEALFGDRLARVAGTMTIEEIVVSGREAFARRTVESAETAMTRMGLTCDSLSVRELDDHGEGYVAALGSPRRAEVQWNSLMARLEVDATRIRQLSEMSRRVAANGTVHELPARSGQLAEETVD